ncbi:hypothetical protein [Pseudomonas palmensis]|uniref:hypothetical protein n=1 Tax=Pseudomonas palmensis TaxID=2815362 RepID=UPI001AE43118|nr:hypothetical protein [Pseudomonas palmensis]
MDTNKMRSDLRASAERAIAKNPTGGDGNPFPAIAVRAVDVVALLAEVERLATSRSKKERELEQELEVWRHGPFCWSCGDTGDVHDITGEWRGECDCLAAQLINANRARDQLKAENEALRKVISQSAASCGAAVSVECTLEFMSILPAEIDSVLAALRKDAERYRWLRQASATDGEYTHGVCIDLWENGCGFEVTLEEADAAVDTAMAKEANRD